MSSGNAALTPRGGGVCGETNLCKALDNGFDVAGIVASHAAQEVLLRRGLLVRSTGGKDRTVPAFEAHEGEVSQARVLNAAVAGRLL